MNLQDLPPEANYNQWICPDIGTYWKLAKVRDSDKIILRSIEGDAKFQFGAAQGYALQHFSGQLTIGQVQQKCQNKFGYTISPNFIIELLQKLIAFGILELPNNETLPPAIDPDKSPQLKTGSPHVEPQIASLQDSSDWICPDLTPYWKLAEVGDSDQVVLKAKEGSLRILFSPTEGYALRYFTGDFTVSQIQDLSQQHFGEHISPNFIIELLQKLIELNILELPTSSATPAPPSSNSMGPKLKPCVHWIEHANGYWILRNSEDVTYLQVSDKDKTIIDQLGQRQPSAIAAEFCITPDYLRQLLKNLTLNAMLEGTTPPKPPKRKFTPMQLLSFRIRLFNPDPWLTRHIESLRWIWTPQFATLLFAFIAFSAIVGINQRHAILYTSQQLIKSSGENLIIPFALLSTLVLTLHELGHAFTLKNYNGIVPEIGLLVMMFIPGAYTNTTDSYCLPRFKRVLVVAAGVLVQLVIWASALWLWNFSITGTWLHTTSYLLMTAALVTVAINLNPLAKFDGYYLAVAISGINNLRSRAFCLDSKLLRIKPIQETPSDAFFLAIYAPFSLAYIWFVFGFMVLRITEWTRTNIPITAIGLFLIWAIYFYFTSKKSN